MKNLDEFIFPNPQEKICIVKAENSNELKGYKLNSKSNLYNLIMNELSIPYFMSMIKLFQLSRNLCKSSYGPNVLYLSDNEGCFPRTGIYIKGVSGYDYYKNLNYVDLVLDEDRVLQGDLYIYTHELAHTIIKNIMPDFPQGKSSIPHFSQCITDYFTAFYEGFAESFERTTCNEIKNFKEIINKKFDFNNNFIKLWICEYDENLRYEGVLKNSFIYNKLLPNMGSFTTLEKLLLEQTSHNFDLTSLKTGTEMLSCEGVVATLFYNIINDKVLQNNYISSNIYNKFLLKPLLNNMDISTLITPYENVIIKILYVMHNMKSQIKDDSIIFIDFIKAWCCLFKEDSERLINIFINLTIGKTIINDPGILYEKIAFTGMLGDVQNISRLIKEYKNSIKIVCDKVLNNELTLDNNLLKEYWVQNGSLNAPQIFYPSNSQNL